MQQKLQLQSGTFISLPSKQFPQRQFKIVQMLGKGGQGDVYLVQPQGWGNFNKNAALKVQSEMRQAEKDFITNLYQYQSNEDKLPINQRTQMIKIYEIVEQQGALILIMELGQESLYDYIQNNKGKLKINDKLKILKQICQGIWFLHYNEKIHRDIKPENFVRVGDEFKLIDFGLVKEIEYLNTVNVGSPLFQAPELKQGKQNYSFEIDIWSLGGTFYELLTEDQLQQTNFQNMIIKSSDQINYNAQNQFRELLQNMMQIEPQKRITIKQVIEWLNQIEFLLQPINAPLPQQNQNIQFQQSANKQLLQASKSVEPQVKQQIDRKSIQQQTHQPFQTNIQPKQSNNPPIQANNFMNQSGQMQNQNFQNSVLPPIQNNQNNNNLKLELQQQLEKQFAQQQEIFKQNFSSITVNLQNLFDQQMKMINQQNAQNLTEIQNIKQEQQNQYQNIQQLIQEQNKQIERIPIQHQKNNIQIGSQVNNEQIELKLSEVNQLLMNSQKEQREIQLGFKKILDSNNESKVENRKQQEMQFQNLFQLLDEIKRQQQQQNQKGQQQLSQDNSSQQLIQILYEQQEMKKLLQFLCQVNVQQKNNFATPNQNTDINQIQISFTRIEKEMKKQNEEVKQQILEQIYDENAKLTRIIQNNDKNTKINEFQNQNEQFIKEISEAIRGVNKSLQNQMNQASLKDINQLPSNSQREYQNLQQQLNELIKIQSQNNYLVYFQDIQQKLQELKQQLMKENQVNKAQGNYTQLSKINTELFELKSLVQNQPSQEKLIQSMEKLIKNNVRYGEMEKGIQEIQQNIQNQEINLKQQSQNTLLNIKEEINKVAQQIQKNHQNSQPQKEQTGNQKPSEQKVQFDKSDGLKNDMYQQRNDQSKDQKSPYKEGYEEQSQNKKYTEQVMQQQPKQSNPNSGAKNKSDPQNINESQYQQVSSSQKPASDKYQQQPTYLNQQLNQKKPVPQVNGQQYNYSSNFGNPQANRQQGHFKH